MEFTLLFAALAGVGAMWLAARLTNGSERPAIPANVFELLVNATVVGLVVGRVWAMVVAGSNPLTNLGDLIIVRGGVDPLGASLGSIGALLWTTRKEDLSAARRACTGCAVGTRWMARRLRADRRVPRSNVEPAVGPHRARIRHWSPSRGAVCGAHPRHRSDRARSSPDISPRRDSCAGAARRKWGPSGHRAAPSFTRNREGRPLPHWSRDRSHGRPDRSTCRTSPAPEPWLAVRPGMRPNLSG